MMYVPALAHVHGRRVGQRKLKSAPCGYPASKGQSQHLKPGVQALKPVMLTTLQGCGLLHDHIVLYDG